MSLVDRGSLIRLRPRRDADYVSQNRTVLATTRDGIVDDEDAHGLFVHETRMVSRLRYLIDGHPPQPIALSNVEQHSWLGYYAARPPGTRPNRRTGSGQVKSLSEETIELRVSRSVGHGVHEDLDVVNYTARRTRVELAVEIAADFADLDEAGGERRQHGSIERSWSPGGDAGGALTFRYRAEHHYDHQGDHGVARIERALAVHVANASSPPRCDDQGLRFVIELGPGDCWHACLRFEPVVDGRVLTPTSDC